MAKPLAIELTAQQRQELRRARNRHAKAYVRERATAILKIAAGQSERAVARSGLLRERRAETLGEWVRRYQQHGLKGLLIRAGRGRKPAFSPQVPAAAHAAVLNVVRRDPHALGFEQARWSLPAIRASLTWLQGHSLSGVHRVLDQLAVVWKRGRASVYSPDPDYTTKVAEVTRLTELVRAQLERLALVYLDEVTVERVPTLGADYEARGKWFQPRAERGHRANTLTRLVGSLDAFTARVLVHRASLISRAQLVRFYQDLVAAYPGRETIYVVQDNWPVHVHPDVLVALQPQVYAERFRYPPNWPTQPSPQAVKRWGQLHLPIQIVPLPTYASWLNPIEKLWRGCRQKVTHLHRYGDDLDALRQALDRFFAQFADGSPELLRYVGLCPH